MCVKWLGHLSELHLGGAQVCFQFACIEILTTSVHLVMHQTFQTNFAILDLQYSATSGVMCYKDISVFPQHVI